MWLHGDHENKVEERSARIRTHYNEVVEELKNSGYEPLVTMKDRISSHLSEVRDQVNNWRGRVLHSELQYNAYGQLLTDLAAERAGKDAEVEETEKAFNSLLDTPIGKVWFDGGAVPFEPKSNWDLNFTGAAQTPQMVSDVTVRYNSTEDALPRYGLHQKYDDYNSESFQSELTRSFTGDTPWNEVFDTLEEQKDANMERKNRASRTEKLLSFRLSVIETVLYRFEAFGTVDKITEDESLKAATQKPSYITNPPDDLFKGRGTKDRTKAEGYARELAELFANDHTDIPEQWTGLHTELESETKKESTGRNKVTCVRSAFKHHSETEEPEDPEALAMACYFYFDDISFG